MDRDDDNYFPVEGRMIFRHCETVRNPYCVSRDLRDFTPQSSQSVMKSHWLGDF